MLSKNLRLRKKKRKAIYKRASGAVTGAVLFKISAGRGAKVGSGNLACEREREREREREEAQQKAARLITILL